MTSTKKTKKKRGTEFIAENQLEVRKINNTESNKEHLLLQETGPSSPPVAAVGAYHNVPEQRLLQKGEEEGEGEARPGTRPQVMRIWRREERWEGQEGKERVGTRQTVSSLQIIYNPYFL